MLSFLCKSNVYFEVYSQLLKIIGNIDTNITISVNNTYEIEMLWNVKVNKKETK